MTAIVVDLDAPVLRSVAVHGSGQLDALIVASTGRTIAALLADVAHLCGRGIDPDTVSRLEALAAHLLSLSPAAARKSIADHTAATWLARLAMSVDEPDAVHLQRLMDDAVWAFLADVAELSRRPAWLLPLSPPTSRRIQPARLRWRLTLDPSVDGPLTIEQDDSGLRLRSPSEDLCRLGPWALADGACQGTVEVLAPGRVVVDDRPFVLDGSVEVLDDDDAIELSGRRSYDERRSPLTTDELDRELSAAFGLIDSIWPVAGAEVRQLFSGLVPISMPGEGWNSASTGELPGVLQLTFRPGGWPYLLADSILHETAHVKLDAATALAPLVYNDDRRIYRHPWRPDLRPLVGVLLGAHAFLAVTQFYALAAARSPGELALRQQAELRWSEVGIALATLDEHADFTPEGDAVYRELVATHEAIGDRLGT